MKLGKFLGAFISAGEKMFGKVIGNPKLLYTESFITLFDDKHVLIFFYSFFNIDEWIQVLVTPIENILRKFDGMLYTKNNITK